MPVLLPSLLLLLQGSKKHDFQNVAVRLGTVQPGPLVVVLLPLLLLLLQLEKIMTY